MPWARFPESVRIKAVQPRPGLHRLDYDERIRRAIDSMDGRADRDPWGKYEQLVELVDLVGFSPYVHENEADFLPRSKRL
jgi:hypothetical protein